MNRSLEEIVSSSPNILRRRLTEISQWDALLTGVIMPGVNGRELAGLCGADHAAALVHRGVVDRGLNSAQKPFSPQQLLTTRREALDPMMLRLGRIEGAP
jgi:hypothetical protein